MPWKRFVGSAAVELTPSLRQLPSCSPGQTYARGKCFCADIKAEFGRKSTKPTSRILPQFGYFGDMERRQTPTPSIEELLGEVYRLLAEKKRLIAERRELLQQAREIASKSGFMS